MKSDRRLSKTRAKCDAPDGMYEYTQRNMCSAGTKLRAAQDRRGTREIRRGAVFEFARQNMARDVRDSSGGVLEFARQNMARNRAADVRRLQVHGREGWLSPARNAVIWLYAKYAEKYLGETGWEDI